MSEIPFHQTRMGKTYYEHTLPRLSELLERIAVALEALSNDDSTKSGG